MAKAGQFVWFELMTRNMDRAKTFFGAVCGWQFHAWDAGNNMPYEMFSPGSDVKGSVGGIMEMHEPEFPPQVPSHIMGYVSVDNADDTTNAALALGATVIHGPEDIPKVGRFAILQDPQGAVFSILQSLNNEWEKEAPSVGHISWCELLTTDVDAAFTFYTTLFGWTVKSEMDMGGGERYRLWDVGGMFKMPSGLPTGAWQYYIVVADLDVALEAVVANGGQVVNGPMDVPGGDRVAQCVDGEGTHFGLTT